MGKGVKEMNEYIMCEKCKRWIVFSEEECGFSFKEARNKEYECGMCKLEMVIESERRKRMELDAIVNVLLAEIEREKNDRENVEVEVRSLREEVDRLKGKVEEVRKEVSVRPKSRAEGGRSRNGIEQVTLSNVRGRSEEGPGRQGEWVKVRGGGSKRVENTIGVDIKNRFSILETLEEETHMVSEREDEPNDIVLGDSQVRDLGMELSKRRKLGTRKRVVMCYPGAGIDFIKERLEVVHGSRDVIIHIGGNNIRKRDGTFERSEVLLKKYRELLARAREMGKKVCVSAILPRLGENEEWWSRALGINERVKALCQNMNCFYLDMWEDFVDSFQLYKKDGVHLNEKGLKVFANRMDECLSLWQGN